ncbi:hypothetical protein ONS95_001100 [Cadophora gregata]|uniref:uncharacterized protein n=1 Tax=Cadophora gregata TaxID=51156 RepID=UPI0026DCE251|nr:uncharacterized protein ONS95_001100 [Cadophora gregata]KAK0129164.1 hypothetical protein ONS95_001100 [Cadophora gregata]
MSLPARFSLLPRPHFSKHRPNGTLRTTLSTALYLKTAAVVGVCIYQILYRNRKDAQGSRNSTADMSRRQRTRYMREFVGDRAEEWWAVVGKGKGAAWIEARREIKARWRAEREKHRRAMWKENIKRNEKEIEKKVGNFEEKQADISKKSKGTILRVTFPWGRSGSGRKR